MNSQYYLCKECMHMNNCVITSYKEKVFSCSEFDENSTEQLTSIGIEVSQLQVNTVLPQKAELEMAL